MAPRTGISPAFTGRQPVRFIDSATRCNVQQKILGRRISEINPNGSATCRPPEIGWPIRTRTVISDFGGLCLLLLYDRPVNGAPDWIRTSMRLTPQIRSLLPDPLGYECKTCPGYKVSCPGGRLSINNKLISLRPIIGSPAWIQTRVTRVRAVGNSRYTTGLYFLYAPGTLAANAAALSASRALLNDAASASVWAFAASSGAVAAAIACSIVVSLFTSAV